MASFFIYTVYKNYTSAFPVCLHDILQGDLHLFINTCIIYVYVLMSQLSGYIIDCSFQTRAVTLT